jgi:ribosome-associated protein
MGGPLSLASRWMAVDDPISIGRGVSVPLAEIELRTSRSSGPGGQHANVTASRVEAVFDVEASRSLGDEEKRRISARYGPVVRAVAQDTRSQARNRELALERLRSRLDAGLTVPRRRRATKPPASARRSRVDAKRRRGELKRLRGRPADD